MLFYSCVVVTKVDGKARYAEETANTIMNIHGYSSINVNSLYVPETVKLSYRVEGSENTLDTKILNITIPRHAIIGDKFWTNCSYSLGKHETLSKVDWLKNGVRIYTQFPTESSMSLDYNYKDPSFLEFLKHTKFTKVSATFIQFLYCQQTYSTARGRTN